LENNVFPEKESKNLYWFNNNSQSKKRFIGEILNAILMIENVSSNVVYKDIDV